MTAPTPTAALTPEELAARTIHKKHERIWLLPFDGEQVTWCDHDAYDEGEGQEYVRADLIDGRVPFLLRGANDALRERDEAIARATAAEAALAASQERERVMREALSKPGMLVYLDSKTEDAAHVVAFPMQTADIDPDRDLTESAETIYAEAAKLGYGDGCAVWCEFSHFPGQYGDYGMREIAPGFEFVGIDPLLTEMFGGRPPEEDAALQPQEVADVR